MDEAPSAGLKVEDRYELVERLGEGSFGEIWVATDTRFRGRRVAVKFLKAPFDRDDEASHRFEKEAHALGMLQHPNVVAAFDRGRCGTRPFLVMEFVDGTALDEWLQRRRDAGRPTDLAAVQDLFDQVCRGVAAAHAVRSPGAIVHRDLKPANVMIIERPDGERSAKVLDFGIAQLGMVNGTLPGTRVGTPDYMAPEQAAGRAARVGPWTDVFALGVILFEMLTLRWYAGDEEQWHYAATTRGGRLDALLNGSRPGVPAAVWRVLARALHPDIRTRYQDAGEFRAALEVAWGEGAVRNPRPWVWSAVGLVVVLLGGAGLWWQHRANTTTASPVPPTATHPPARDGVAPPPTPVAPPPAPSPCPDGMVQVPGASFMMGVPGGGNAGNAGDAADARPAHGVTLGAYCIDRTETTVAAWNRCAAEGRCPPAPQEVNWPGIAAADRAFGSRFCNGARADRAEHPINCVAWAEAEGYCRWRGARLPTEAEWEYAARGADGRPYPWGTAAPTGPLLNACGAECGRLGTQLGQRWQAMYPDDDGWETTAPVGIHPAGASPWGVLDMAGNVAEWTADRYGPYPAEAVIDPHGPDGDGDAGGAGDARRVVRGGSWNFGNPAWMRTTYRDAAPPTLRDRYLGFRCARDAAR